MQFIGLEVVQENSGGTFDFQKVVVEAVVVPSEISGGLALQVEDPSGDTTLVEGDGGEFANGTFHSDYGTVVWLVYA